MTTNQTNIISDTKLLTVIGNVNAFVITCIAAGYINFDIKRVVATPEYSITGLPTGSEIFTVQVNYYNPSLY